jgi:hypothetical protein
MYGSVALWAWEEAALHLQISGVGKIIAERFSKHSLLPPITVEIGDVSQEWAPTLAIGADSTGSLLDVLTTMESGATVDELTTFTGLGRDAINRQLRKLEEEEKVEKIDSVRGKSGGRRAIVWGATTP